MQGLAGWVGRKGRREEEAGVERGKISGKEERLVRGKGYYM